MSVVVDIPCVEFVSKRPVRCTLNVVLLVSVFAFVLIVIILLLRDKVSELSVHKQGYSLRTVSTDDMQAMLDTLDLFTDDGSASRPMERKQPLTADEVEAVSLSTQQVADLLTKGVAI